MGFWVCTLKLGPVPMGCSPSGLDAHRPIQGQAPNARLSRCCL